MIPSPAEVVRFRAVGAAGLRLGGVVYLLVAARSGLAWLVEGLRDNDFLNLDTYSGEVIALVFYGVLGCVLVIGAPRWARWLLPMPDSLACPACGYAIPGLTAPVCPECGLALPAEFRGKQAHEGPISNSAWLARWRMVTVLPLRLVAMWLVVSMIPESVQLYALGDSTDVHTGVNQLLTYLAAVALWMLSPLIARRCIHPRLWKRLGRAR